MQTIVLWKGIDYNSLEHCKVLEQEDGAEITSVIVGSSGRRTYRIDYRVRTNHNWQMLHAELKAVIDGAEQTYVMSTDGVGDWMMNGRAMPEFAGCTDIDIPLTPFTNTLPIRRLKLAVAKEAEVQVVYFDLMEGSIRPVQQRYMRMSEHVYHYENIPNDFEADIKVDDHGLVVDYPSLFVRGV
ncbi:MAG: hypothetical protein EOP56_17965 [Sphingobacteriales bacterium]|nr:MAG: hypothetical protein EOP56_17965 [Sphingobacteriales bacterium]